MTVVSGTCLAQIKNHNNENNKNQKNSMTIVQTNKEIIRQLYEEALNKRDTGLLHQLISSEYTSLSNEKGVAVFEGPVNTLIKAFPDIQWQIEELMAEGDKVAIRWTWQGTQENAFQNFAATGRVICNDGMAVYELKDGKVIRAHLQTDRLGFLQQLEALPKNLFAGRKDPVVFIDKFFVPQRSIAEFRERSSINMRFILTQPGLLDYAAYERDDEEGNLIFITMVAWESEDVLKKAKEAVQAEYRKQGFNLAEMIERLEITIDRGEYKKAYQKL